VTDIRSSFAPSPGVVLQDAIASLCDRVDRLARGCRTGICIANPERTELERAIFPNLPTSFQSSIKDIPIGPPYFGSCTAAMDGDVIITCHDMASEARFDERFVATCVQHGIFSLQSRPVHGRDGKPIGTFVMTFAEPRVATDFNVAVMNFAAEAVSALLQRELDTAQQTHAIVFTTARTEATP
jgi:hypothetical protein